MEKLSNYSGFEIKLSKASDFRIKILQCVRFLFWMFYNPSVFGLKKTQGVWFWNENFSPCQILKQDLVQFTPWKRHFLHLSCFFKKHDFELKSSLRVRFLVEKITTRQFLNLKTNILRHFLNLKRIPCVTAWVKNFTKFQSLNQLLTTGQTLNWIFYNVSYFDCTSFAVCNVFMYSSKHSTFR